MKKLFTFGCLCVAVFFIGCTKKTATEATIQKDQVRAIQVAGIPIYEKDYRLSTRSTPDRGQP